MLYSEPATQTPKLVAKGPPQDANSLVNDRLSAYTVTEKWYAVVQFCLLLSSCAAHVVECSTRKGRIVFRIFIAFILYTVHRKICVYFVHGERERER